MKLINIGFGSLIAAERLISVLSPDSAPIKRMIQDTRERGLLVDASYGRKTNAEYVGNRYGTPRGYVESRLLEGRSVVLDIEVQGAAQVQRNCPDAVTVFILPPSGEELERRLRHRNTDSDEKIRERLLQAKRECAEAGKYGYIVVNDDPDRAAKELDAILTAEKCKTADRIKLVTEVLIS